MTLTDEHAGYNVRAYETAGWYRHTVDPIIGTTERDNRDGGHGGTFTTPTLRAPAATVEERRDLVQAVRNALPGIGAVDGLRAARTLRGLRSHPADVAYRAAVAMIPSDGTIPAFPRVTDGWETRQHETVQKRTRKGRTTVERKRVGIAPVRGTTLPVWNGHDDGISDAACLARMLATAEIDAEHVTTPDKRNTIYGARRLRSGARVGLDVQRVTDRHYRWLGVPALLGTDVTSWEQVIDTPKGVDPARCRVAVGRSYGDDVVPSDVAAAIAGDRAEYVSHTRKPVTFPTRIALRTGRKRSGDPRGITYYRGATAADGVRTLYGYWQRVTLCVAPAASVDHRYRGHVLVTRPRVQTRDHRGTRADRLTRQARAAVKRDARTIGTVEAPETVQGIATLLENVNRGERVQLRTAAGLTAVTRATSGLYATQYTRPDGKRATYRTRSALAMATFLAQ